MWLVLVSSKTKERSESFHLQWIATRRHLFRIKLKFGGAVGTKSMQQSRFSSKSPHWWHHQKVSYFFYEKLVFYNYNIPEIMSSPKNRKLRFLEDQYRNHFQEN